MEEGGNCTQYLCICSIDLERYQNIFIKTPGLFQWHLLQFKALPLFLSIYVYSVWWWGGCWDVLETIYRPFTLWNCGHYQLTSNNWRLKPAFAKIEKKQTMTDLRGSSTNCFVNQLCSSIRLFSGLRALYVTWFRTYILKLIAHAHLKKLGGKGAWTDQKLRLN